MKLNDITKPTNRQALDALATGSGVQLLLIHRNCIKRQFAMPLVSPYYPPGPYCLRDREYSSNNHKLKGVIKS
jgi:hypothetical protein